MPTIVDAVLFVPNRRMVLRLAGVHHSPGHSLPPRFIGKPPPPLLEPPQPDRLIVDGERLGRHAADRPDDAGQPDFVDQPGADQLLRRIGPDPQRAGFARRHRRSTAASATCLPSTHRPTRRPSNVMAT